MRIESKKAKIAVYGIILLEIVFLIRTYLIYSFYTNDEAYGDGVSNPSKYDHDFYLTVFISFGVTAFFILAWIILLKRSKNEK